MTNIVEIKNVSKKINNRDVLDNISLNITKGRSLMFLGPNGAGKTTTIRIMMNLLNQDKGSVSLFGKVISKTNIAETRKKVGVQSDSEMYQELTIKENLIFFAELYGLKKKYIYERLQYLLSFFDLEGKENYKLSQLSKGMRQKVSLARAMFHNPELLVLDEPTAGLDPESCEELISYLEKLVKESKLTLIMCTHQLVGLERLADEIVIIKKGKIIAKNNKIDLENEKKYIADTSDNNVVYSKLKKSGVDVCLKHSKIEFRVDTKKNLNYVIKLIENLNISINLITPKVKTIKDFYFEAIKGEERNE